MRSRLPGVRVSEQVFSRPMAVRQSTLNRTTPLGRGAPSTASVRLPSPRSAATGRADTGKPSSERIKVVRPPSARTKLASICTVPLAIGTPGGTGSAISRAVSE